MNEGMTPQEVRFRAAEKRRKRFENKRFIAKMNGTITRIPRKLIVKQLDNLFSLYVRRRDRLVLSGRCVFGCGRPIECCFHFITRSKHSVRWDPKNAVGSCHADNYTMEFNPHPYIEWYLRTHGKEAYDDLIERSNKIAKFSYDELLEIKKQITSWIENSSKVQEKGFNGE